MTESRIKELANALGRDLKGKLSFIGYLVAIAIAIKSPAIAITITIYALIACIWLVPDRRIERNLPPTG
ncbi:MAG: hypothetical protein H6818_14200 [Phycisphaerales bacterium]|nr:hypothetical protein [Phycisphaerales bacterium]MCB9862044.1 hypothetical protein [Phycisphaerales bacterium]